MMTEKHTPGPWTQSVEYIQGRDELDICRLSNTHLPETYANARLIAAAPDLLEALENTLAQMPFSANWDKNGNNPQWLKAARAAIAKATGTAYAIKTTKGYLAVQGDTSWFQDAPTGWALYASEEHARENAEPHHSMIGTRPEEGYTIEALAKAKPE